MKKMLLLCSALLCTSAFASIVRVDDKLFLRSKGKQVPLLMVNELIQNKTVTKVKLYGEGRVPMVSFAKKNEKEKLYSVDEKGFVYSIEPFASYDVADIGDDGSIRFKQVPGRKYKINSQGFFLY